MSSPLCYIGQILAEIAFGLQSLSEVPHIKVHKVYESLSRGIRVAIHTHTHTHTHRRMNRHDEAKSRFRNCFLKKTDKGNVCWRNCILILQMFEDNLNFIGPLWSLTAMCRDLMVSDSYV